MTAPKAVAQFGFSTGDVLAWLLENGGESAIVEARNSGSPHWREILASKVIRLAGAERRTEMRGAYERSGIEMRAAVEYHGNESAVEARTVPGMVYPKRPHPHDEKDPETGKPILVSPVMPTNRSIRALIAEGDRKDQAIRSFVDAKAAAAAFAKSSGHAPSNYSGPMGGHVVTEAEWDAAVTKGLSKFRAPAYVELDSDLESFTSSDYRSHGSFGQSLDYEKPEVKEGKSEARRVAMFLADPSSHAAPAHDTSTCNCHGKWVQNPANGQWYTERPGTPRHPA